jgi:hypothetical protein
MAQILFESDIISYNGNKANQGFDEISEELDSLGKGFHWRGVIFYEMGRAASFYLDPDFIESEKFLILSLKYKRREE